MKLLGKPYSKLRKCLWIACFVCALVNAPGCFLDGVPIDMARKYAFYTALSLFACYVNYDVTWEKKEEDEE